MKVTVTHIGQDYGKVEVFDAGHVTEFEVPLALAEALKEVL